MKRVDMIKNHLKKAASTGDFYGRSHWVMKNCELHECLNQKVGSLKGKTILVTGGSRGIGLAIAKRAAADGANVAIAAKTAEPHPKLPGTIYTAAKEIEEAGGKALAIMCDIRSEEQVISAVEKTVQAFGGIDIVINNASAINLTPTSAIDMKRYDLMHHINTRGTFMVSQKALPYLMKSKNPHILNLSPPLNMEERWFKGHTAYTMAKYGMSMCVLGMAGEFREHGIGVNALWPRTTIATAAVNNLLGGSDMMKHSRKPDIMGDAAYEILTSDSKLCNGNFFVDDEVLYSVGVHDLGHYRVDQSVAEIDLFPDYFV